MIEYFFVNKLTPLEAFIAGLFVAFLLRIIGVFILKKIKQNTLRQADALQELNWEHIEYKNLIISIAEVHKHCWELRIRQHAKLVTEAIHNEVLASREQCITVGEDWINTNGWKQGFTI